MGTRKHPVQENLAYFVTTVVAGRRPIFNNDESAELLIEEIRHARAAREFALLAFAVMPDHVHLLFVPAEGTTVSDVMRVINGRFARTWNQRHGARGPLWQARFFESGVRSHAQFRRWVDCIHQNPVAAGLAGTPERFPYSSASRPELTDIHTYFSGQWAGQARSLAV